MWRNMFLSGIVILCAVGTSTASITLSLEGLPSSYSPGSSVQFDVKLTGATNLNSFNIGLILSSTSGIAGTDFYFQDPPATDRPSDADNTYVFDEDLVASPPFGFFAAPALLGNQAILTLSDFLSSGELALVQSPNTIVAHVTLATTSVARDLSIGFDLAKDSDGNYLLQLLDEDGNTIPDFDPGDASQVAGPAFVDSGVDNVVPEPSAFLVWLVLGAVFLAAGIRHG